MAQMITIGTKAINLDHVKIILPYNTMDKDKTEVQFTIACSLVGDKFEILKKFESQIDRDNELKTLLEKING